MSEAGWGGACLKLEENLVCASVSLKFFLTASVLPTANHVQIHRFLMPSRSCFPLSHLIFIGHTMDYIFHKLTQQVGWKINIDKISINMHYYMGQQE